MAEEEAGGPESAGERAEENPTAVALAMAGASRLEADRFLQHQRHLSDEQNHYLRQTIRPTIWGQWLSVFLRAATAVVGMSFAAAVALMVRDAAGAQGLLIEPFSVPAGLAERGLNGQAFSSMLLDKLTGLQEQTQSTRPPQSYSNNWGDDLKVEIPETGVSLGELRRYLREWLGHDTHISGEVWQDAKGISIAARAGGSKGEVVTGPESDLDALMQKAAENIYRVTQPYRYANYLDRDDFHPGFTDIPAAEAIYRRLVTDPNPQERAYAWNGLANLAWTVKNDDGGALDFYRRSVSEDPTFAGAHFGIAFLEHMHFSHPEAALVAGRAYARTSPGFDKKNWLDVLSGDYADSLATLQRGLRSGAANPAIGNAALAYALLHDRGGLRTLLRAYPSRTSRRNNVPFFWMNFLAEAALKNWQGVLAAEPAVEKLLLDGYPGWDHKVIFQRALRPRLALARAMTGDFAAAEALIAPAPADCYDCLRIRGRIAAEQKQWARADYWFARAVAEAPSIPFAHEDWGRALLARGDAQGAEAQFLAASKRGPHFADAIEGRGEALMAQNLSHKALAKFAEAERYTPNWGRLHLKWGEALTHAGKTDEAAKHFARAAALDLTPAEQAELAKHP